LRCRPETAPFSPTWNGLRTTVARGLRPICNRAVDSANAKVGELAGRLGIGERHLVRLFTKHLGANPGQVGKTLRVQRVKRLLDTTDLPRISTSVVGFRCLSALQPTPLRSRRDEARRVR
jgi:AraC family transcriptional regulator, regulatory protein of adaptative response / methylated-DNA-[protein]-cysteine methyltransferase